MGFFDRFRKKKKEEPPQETRIAARPEAPEKREASADDNRRFTLLVEDTFQLRDQMGVVCVGTVHGTIRVKDAVYIVHPGNRITLATVSELEQKSDGQMEKVYEATDSPVGVRLSEAGTQIQKYSVLTSIRPQPTVDINTAVENPAVLGMACEYSRFQKEREFLGILIYAIVHAHFLVPVFLGKEPEKGEDGKAVFAQGTTMSFPSLKHPSDENKSVFPVFTDWNELSQWTKLFDEQHPPRMMIFQFSDCASAVGRHDGMVINPFGRHPIFLSSQMVKNIVGSESYQKEFGQDGGARVEPVTVGKETKVMLGVPQESGEVRLIREAITACAKRIPQIESIYLLLKIVQESGEKAYLCVIDCPEEEARGIFDQIYQEVKPYGNAVTTFEFLPKSKSDSLENSLTDEARVYQK